LLPKNLRIHAVLIVACIFMILIPLYNQKPNTEKIEQAAPIALAFLQLIDAGQFADSWQSSAGLMQERVKQQEWVEKLTSARNLSGELVARSRKSASYSTEAKDSPEGEYIMLIYTSRFEKAEEVDEYVTVMREGETWKVAGYFMQQ